MSDTQSLRTSSRDKYISATQTWGVVEKTARTESNDLFVEPI